MDIFSYLLGAKGNYGSAKRKPPNRDTNKHISLIITIQNPFEQANRT